MRKGGDRYYVIYDKVAKDNIVDGDGDRISFDDYNEACDYITMELADNYELTEKEAETRFEVESLRW